VRLSSLDLLRFRAVCGSWRAAAAAFTARRGCPRPDCPWLLLPTDVSADLTLDRGRLIVCPDREVSVEAWTPSQRAWATWTRARFVPLGSVRGSIVAVDERGEMPMHLLDLVSGARKPLPAIATLPLVDRKASRSSTSVAASSQSML